RPRSGYGSWVALRWSAPQSYRFDPAGIQGRQYHDDRGAVTIGTANGELTTHRLHTLLDAQQSVPLANTRGLEATAVVAHVQTHFVRREYQSCGEATGVGVPDRVREHLLTDAEHVFFP